MGDIKDAQFKQTLAVLWNLLQVLNTYNKYILPGSVLKGVEQKNIHVQYLHTIVD